MPVIFVAHLILFFQSILNVRLNCDKWTLIIQLNLRSQVSVVRRRLVSFSQHQLLFWSMQHKLHSMHAACMPHSMHAALHCMLHCVLHCMHHSMHDALHVCVLFVGCNMVAICMVAICMVAICMVAICVVAICVGCWLQYGSHVPAAICSNPPSLAV